MIIQPVAVFWFRRDLRFYDNHGFFEALRSSETVLPVFIFDPNILGELKDKKDKRVTYIFEALEALHKKFMSLGSGLLVVHDEPLKAIKSICLKFEVKQVFTNTDYEPYAFNRDREICEWLETKNIPFHTFKDQVIFGKSEVMKTDGTPYTVFTPYSKIWKQKLAETGIENYPSEKLLSGSLKQNIKFPSLAEIGFERAAVSHNMTLPDKEVILHYDETRNIPSLAGTSRMSVHLRFGTVSIRELVKTALKLNEQWLNELIWREFFMMILYHFPKVVTCSFKPKYEGIEWINSKKDFGHWCEGKTGYPLVDAGMREMNETGLMHNRVRMVTASFLTKHLLIDWRWGEAYFAEKLLDYELSSNNGNWQWAAGCGCDAAPYFRVFNPYEQTRKFDPELKYIKKWIKDFSPDYLPPIVDHDFARKRAIATYKKALTEI
ncbi:MAG: deoxyribodipyrimidine photo-lyase [Flavobacteriaceae bacterium]|nr:deoxyribodipyrimidine photo-lyase [Flavobacteriaceae bacterium]